MKSIDVVIEQYRMAYEQAVDDAAWARMMWQACITATSVFFLAGVTFMLLGAWLAVPAAAMAVVAGACFVIHYARAIRFDDEAEALSLHITDLEYEVKHGLVD